MPLLPPYPPRAPQLVEHLYPRSIHSALATLARGDSCTLVSLLLYTTHHSFGRKGCGTNSCQFDLQMKDLMTHQSLLRMSSFASQSHHLGTATPGHPGHPGHPVSSHTCLVGCFRGDTVLACATGCKCVIVSTATSKVVNIQRACGSHDAITCLLVSCCSAHRIAALPYMKPHIARPSPLMLFSGFTATY